MTRYLTGSYSFQSPIQIETGESLIWHYVDDEVDAVLLRHRDGSREVLWQREYLSPTASEEP